LATNFIVSGLGVISVYMLIIGLPVWIIISILTVTNLVTSVIYKSFNS